MHPPPADGVEIDPLERWESAVDRAIREAQRRGEFDDLPGHGKPLCLEDNPFAGDREAALRILKNAGMVPYWMELEKEIGAERAALHELLERSARHLRPPLVATRTDGAGEGSAGRNAANLGGRPTRFAWWPFRRERSGTRRAEGARGPGVADLEADHRRARRAYLERAALLDQKIGRYNAALPEDLRWRERPRLSPEAAARAFDATCPPITRDALSPAPRAAGPSADARSDSGGG